MNGCYTIIENTMAIWQDLLGTRAAPSDSNEPGPIPNGFSMETFNESIGVRFGAAVVGKGDKIYMLGGFRSSTQSWNEVYVFDVVSKKWSLLISGVTGLTYGAAVLVGDILSYYYGYTRSGSPTNFIGTFNVSTLSAGLAGVGNATQYVSAAATGDDVYLTGGNFQTSFIRKSVSNPAIHQVLPNLPIGGSGHQSAIVGDYLYMFGGNMGGYLQRYNLTTQVWNTVSSNMTQTSSHSTATVLDGHIYAMNQNGTGIIRVDVETGTTTQVLPALAINVVEARLVSLGGSLYATNGAQVHKFTPNY